jgi:hypothetical protein
MNDDLKRIFIPIAIALATASVLFIIRGIAFRFLHAWAKKNRD